MASNISIPNLRAWVKLDTQASKFQIADQIGSALGLQFGSDSIGWFEELDALVGRVFYFVIGVYEIHNDTDINDRQINIELRSMINKSLVGNKSTDVETEYLDISEFLSALLHVKTELGAYPIKEDSQQLDSIEKQIPNFQVSLQTESHLSLEQISARVGVALGLSFGQTVGTLERGYYKGQPWYSQVAYSLEHQINIYVATAHHRLSTPRPVALEIRPNFQVEQLDLDPKVTKIRKLNISEYIASILQIETDLTFQ